jgi:hypothetical protein
MKGRSLILIVIIWVVWKIIEHYLVIYFFVPFLYVGLSLALLIIIIIQLAKLLKERKAISKLRVFKVMTFLLLFYLTFYRWTFDKLIEKADFYVLYNKRVEIVNQVKDDKLKPNVSWNNWICELPYEFPIISHGGNDIGISKSEDNETMTITFFVFRNFFSAPSTKFIYTTRADDIKYYDEQVSKNSADNWKIENNWYRILSE